MLVYGYARLRFDLFQIPQIFWENRGLGGRRASGWWCGILVDEWRCLWRIDVDDVCVVGASIRASWGDGGG